MIYLQFRRYNGWLCMLLVIQLTLTITSLLHANSHETILKRTDPTVILQLYQLMHDIDAVFRRAKIPYWIDFGTLLGAVRHKGIIPWDEDCDISIERKYKGRLQALKPVFSKLGYTLRKAVFSNFYKLFPKNGIPNPVEPSKFPFVDIFIRVQVDDRIYYVDKKNKITPIWGKRNWEPLYIEEKELFPLKRYTFGSLSLSGPAKPQPFLQAHYGADWNVVGYRQFDHCMQEMIKKVKVRLTQEDRMPAQPMGPLKTHDYHALFTHHTSRMARS